MSLLLPRIGVTSCSRAESFLTHHIQNVIGSFWVMAGYGFDEKQIPSWWIDLVLEENQAQGILDAYSRGLFNGQHENPLYLGFCIIVSACKQNPANISYLIQHLRMNSSEGIALLKILAQHNIPAHTEVSYPSDYLSTRYRSRARTSLEQFYPPELKEIDSWSVEMWEDYCSYLLAEHGTSMLSAYWEK